MNAYLAENSQPLDSFEAPMTTADHFVAYKDCIIERHGNRFYIIKPSGVLLKKEFSTVEDAKEEIDIVAPLLQKKQDTRQKIYNIRYVR